ncbi:MAG: precorrin-2 C(20)-methyltransferase [Lachnospiraceae bacterium]|nr:precorrin-2 C(20)-methyltransferase [Lachnospiraceae bacterium]
MEKGILTGIGVGPGDPELMTIKAVNAIRDADVLILPASDRAGCRAYEIARQICNEIGEKECIFEPFPMSMDKEELHKFHERVALKIGEVLDEGRNAAFLTIGDPSVYSTFGYIAAPVIAAGYRVERISGVTSFCAAANRLGVTLCEGKENLHILAGFDDEKLPDDGDTRVFMKVSKNIAALKDKLIKYEEDGKGRVYAVKDCGLPDEEVFYPAKDIADDTGYMTVIIAAKAGPDRRQIKDLE